MAPVGLHLPWRHAPPPLSGKAGDVFFEIHSYLRDIDGLHADEALDELCKLLYAKLYDEEQIPPGQAGRMRRGNGSSDECAADVRALYLEAAEHDRRSGGDENSGIFPAASAAARGSLASRLPEQSTVLA